MPEKFSRQIDQGFISVWEIDEPVSFFEKAAGTPMLSQLSDQHSNHRLLQKLVPHFILRLYHENVELNNLDRKPVASKGYVSISHCKHTLALFYHPHRPVGIDIEHEHPKVLRIRKKFMNNQELAFCGDDVVRCLVIWAAKEALFKKHGNETSFFAQNIAIAPFASTAPFDLDAQVRVNGTLISEKLRCELNQGLVMVHTL